MNRLLLCLFLLVCTNALQGALVTLEFEGTLSASDIYNNDTGLPTFDSSVREGSIWYAKFEFATEGYHVFHVEREHDRLNRLRVRSNDIFRNEFWVGDYVIPDPRWYNPTPTAVNLIWDSHIESNQDVIRLRGNHQYAIGPAESGAALSLRLSAPSTTFPDFSEPQNFLSEIDFESYISESELELTFYLIGSGGGDNIRSQLNLNPETMKISVSSVPEPSSYGLAGTLFLGFLLVRKKVKQRSLRAEP